MTKTASPIKRFIRARLVDVFNIFSYPLAGLFIITRFVDNDFYSCKYKDVIIKGLHPTREYARYGLKARRMPNKFIEGCIETSSFYSLARFVQHYFRFVHSRTIYTKLLPIADITTQDFTWVRLDHIAPKRNYTFTEAPIFGEALQVTSRTVPVPEQWIAKIENADVIAGFQVATPSHLVVFEPAANPYNQYVAGLQQSVFPTSDRNNTWKIKYSYLKSHSLESAVLISGRCSPNYFHWLIEYAPRAYVLSKRPALNNVPLIIDKRMTTQQMDSLNIIFAGHPIFFHDTNNLLQVKNLYIPSLSTYHPDNFLKFPFWKGCTLCYDSLDFIRKKIYDYFKLQDNLPAPYRRIYLARRGARNLLNIDEINALLKQENFEMIFPEDLSFEQQVLMFYNAKSIIGVVGAAFSNLIFCRKDTNILGLMSPFAKGYNIQANLAAYAKCKYQLLLGKHANYKPEWSENVEATEANLYTIHENFSVDVEQLTRAIAEYGL